MKDLTAHGIDLKIPDHWVILGGFPNNLDDVDEDICALVGDGIEIDVGSYLDFHNDTIHIICRVAKDGDWDNPIIEFEPDMDPLVEAKKWMIKVAKFVFELKGYKDDVQTT